MKDQTSHIRERVADAVRKLGLRETARRLGLSNETTARIALGDRNQSGSIALAEQRVAELETPVPGDAA